MLELLNLLKDGTALIHLKDIKKHLIKLEKELNDISKLLNHLSFDINNALEIILKNKSKSIINEKKLTYLENQFEKL